MVRALPRLSRILLASAVVFAPSALAQPSPSPVPVPYPLVNEARADPSPTGDTAGVGRVILCIPVKVCLPKAAGTLQLQTSQVQRARPTEMVTQKCRHHRNLLPATAA